MCISHGQLLVYLPSTGCPGWAAGFAVHPVFWQSCKSPRGEVAAGRGKARQHSLGRLDHIVTLRHIVVRGHLEGGISDGDSLLDKPSVSW